MKRLGFALATLFVVAGFSAAGLRPVVSGPVEVFISEASAAGDKIEQARLGESIAVRASGRGNPWVNLGDGREMLASYSGADELRQAVEQGEARPISLASADFDEDGVADLVCGYAGPGGGIIALYRGNLDSIYPNAPEAKRREAQGVLNQAPFLAPAHLFAVSEAADFIGAGDFDGDGHWDVVTAVRGGNKLRLLAGDGRGALSETGAVELQDRVTAMAVGDVNRRDGLTDVVVGMTGPRGPKAMVYEGPQGALRADPESFDLPAEATSLILAQLDRSYEIDLAVAAGRHLVIMKGRDRKLTLKKHERAEVPTPFISSQAFPFAIESLAAGDFISGSGSDIALLSTDGEVHLLSAADDQDEQGPSVAEWKRERVIEGRWPESTQILGARVSSSSTDDLLVLDSSADQIHILTGGRATGESNSSELSAHNGLRRKAVTLDVEGHPIATLPMRLNPDALSDLVMLKTGSAGITVATTQPNLTFTVTSASGVGPGSLFEAILDSNENPGADIIVFNIPGTGPFTITQSVQLPPIVDPVLIDGTTQPGFAGTPIIEITSGSPTTLNGITVLGGSTVLRGLVINGFGTALNLRFGIDLQTGGGNFIEGNFIGTDVTGTIGKPNSYGVFIQTASANNVIGGTTAAARNLISGNSNQGITLASSGNLMLGNYVGTNITGTSAVANLKFGGVQLFRSTNNTVGGTTAGARNIISGNGDLINGAGIMIEVSDANGNLIQGNFVGTDLTGTIPLGNSYGVWVRNNAHHNTIGGTAPGARNVISGNQSDGVRIIGTVGDSVQGNFIGTDVNGTADLGNGGNGVSIQFSPDCSIGGLSTGARNIISGNTLSGIFIEGPQATGNRVQGNYIGTSFSGTSALGNGLNGVTISDAPGNTIGGPTIEARNILSGNGRHGVSIGVDATGGSTGNTVRNNYIGTDAGGVNCLGNQRDGVFVNLNSAGNTIIENRIACNSRNGVNIPNFAVGNPGVRITIQSNSIYSNGHLGIDLGLVGVTANDPGDPDAGANNLQNFPVLTSAMTLALRPSGREGLSPETTATIRIVGNLNGTPNTDFFVQFFSASQCSNSNPGVNQQALNFVPILFHTDVAGNAPIDITFENVTIVGGWVNAMARDARGNTSEFSQCILLDASAGCTYSLDSTGQSFPSNGGGGSISVTAPAGCVWTTASNSSFITITAGPDGTGNGMVGYQVAANPASGDRTGTVTVAGQTFTVMQQGAPAPCSFSLSSSGQKFTAAGGSDGFTVTTAAGCNWAPITDVGWITATGGGSGNGAVSYAVAENTSGPRTGHITVQDQVFTINQDGAATVCAYSITPGSAVVAGTGGGGSFQLTTGASCTWNAATNVPWIMLPSSGVGGGMINYTVMANSGSPRTGKIFVEGQQFTIDQGQGCSLALSAADKSFAANGGTGSTDVIAMGGCAWLATSNVPWIHITSGDSGSGNGTVSYSVDANTGATIREGTITIGNRTYTVLQGIPFSDVPLGHPFYTEIGKLSARGVTLGCDTTNYCPDLTVTRQQMAAFIIRALGDFTPPPPPMQRFSDVPPTNPFYAFIEQMAVRQITLGCSPNMYCPTDPVLRDQMAAFIIRALHEPGYIPPVPAMQRFMDVPPSNPFYGHIEEMAVRGITLGCGGGNYCPSLEVSRGQMAAFLVRAFNL
ncbi:MAG TPA: BACON domain-containing carbohydrate-binding protein [Blastocatellia bacterium]|nr:BACON domain-containing carbohydrate-binding protein [Blastocatellia bacterium]